EEGVDLAAVEVLEIGELAVVVAGEVVDGQPHLLDVVAARQARGRLAHLLHRREKQTNQDGDDGNYHQQFDEGEATPPGRGCVHVLCSSSRECEALEALAPGPDIVALPAPLSQELSRPFPPPDKICPISVIPSIVLASQPLSGTQ